MMSYDRTKNLADKIKNHSRTNSDIKITELSSNKLNLDWITNGMGKPMKKEFNPINKKNQG